MCELKVFCFSPFPSPCPPIPLTVFFWRKVFVTTLFRTLNIFIFSYSDIYAVSLIWWESEREMAVERETLSSMFKCCADREFVGKHFGLTFSNIEWKCFCLKIFVFKTRFHWIINTFSVWKQLFLFFSALVLIWGPLSST